MSFRKWLSNKVYTPKAKIDLTLEKSKFLLGEQIRGQATIISQEEIDVTDVSVVLTCNESVKKTRVTSSQYGTHQSDYWDQGEIYRAKHVFYQNCHLAQGLNQTCTFALLVPTAAKETCYSIDRYVKWYLTSTFDVKGRPDIHTETYEVLIEKPIVAATTYAPVIKEVVKEIVLIPCGYCGSLMPQTAIFCPNCGARRKT
ncbi:MAG: zinc ribbon domain-containing protein [Candidatus Bathyarchaeia archaeon]|jgi:hypothetical protein